MLPNISLTRPQLLRIRNSLFKPRGNPRANHGPVLSLTELAGRLGLRRLAPSRNSDKAGARRNRRGRWRRAAAGVRTALRKGRAALREDRKDPCWLTEKQTRLLRPSFPKSRGKRRADDRVVLSGIIFVIRHGLRWCDAPPEYGPHKTLHNRWKRWSDKGVFLCMMLTLASGSRETHTLMIDSTFIKAHRTACCLQVILGKEGRRIGRTVGGWTCKPHIVSDAKGRPILVLLTAGNVSDIEGARALLESLPKAKVLLADRAYDAAKYRDALKKKGIDSCIPQRKIKNRKKKVPYDKELYKSRNGIERCFGALKDFRRVSTRYDRCPNVFLSACALAAVVKFWLPKTAVNES